MASLMEDLIDALHQECDLYEALMELSGKKTTVIVAGDLDELSRITDEEQECVSEIVAQDKRRSALMKDIASVLNRDVESLRLIDLVDILEKRPKEQKRLAVERDRLKRITDQVRRVNGQNQELLKSSLEMVEFELNVLQASSRAPETANYTKAAGTSGDVIGNYRGGFDAKQ